MNKFAINILYIFFFFTLCQTQGFSKPVINTASISRKVVSFNSGWKFHFAYDVRRQADKVDVTLPHTWNAKDVLSGTMNYKRETGIYEKSIFINRDWKEKRLFLYFEGANSVATVLVNQHFVAQHKGGYTAFCLEITDFVKSGTLNNIEVQVSNAFRTDVLPLSGDFNIYGGIHRPVSLLITEKDCISPLDYGASGVYLTPRGISSTNAFVNIVTKLSIASTVNLKIRSDILNEDQQIVSTNISAITNPSKCIQNLNLINPHLWNGKAAPYLYHVKVSLLRNGQVIDEVVQPLGLRKYTVDTERGFLLNGQHLDLHGLGFHEDVMGKGSALDSTDYEKDMALIKEIGATAVRLTHYPHGKYFYDLCDQYGLVVWSEIPFVGPGGYTGTGYFENKDLENQVKNVLTEMIRQNYNHPSICFWGLFNELKLDQDDPRPFLKELNILAKKEDPSRLTTCASFVDGNLFNDVTDLIAWNKYYGWYGGEFKEIGRWADNIHQQFPQKPFAVSEFGAGGSPFKHTENDAKPDADGHFHPEEWQSSYHEANWRELNKRPFIWGKFVWCLADFGSSIRTEGDNNGLNDKGLVTYDRSIKKDAFYFYKANWNNEPMIYITDKRNNIRSKLTTSIKIYSTVPNVTLVVNGIAIKQGNVTDNHIIIWNNIALIMGKNKIKAMGNFEGKVLEDSCEWTVSDQNADK